MKVLLVVYDNDSYVSWFPHGLAYIASYLEKAGHDVTVYNQDVYHYTEEHLTLQLDRFNFDVVCVGVIAGYYQYAKLLKISKAVHNSKNEPMYILGGHGPSAEPEFFLRKTGADYVVIGEGENTIVELLDHTIDQQDIDGIAYIDEDENRTYVRTNPRELIKNVDDILHPAWNKFPINHYALQRQVGFKNSDRMLPVLSARGCPFTCNFCYRLDKGYRQRSPESIIHEIKDLKNLYNINAIDFSDELLMSSKHRTKKLCEAFIKSDLNIKWSCNGRLNYADEETLTLMKRAGCVYVNYGIESIDDGALERMNKKLTVSTIINGVEATNNVGIHAGLNIIFGNIGETKEILEKDVAFLIKYGDGSQLRTIRPVTPYPGSPLYYYAIERGLLEGAEDFYENKHLNSDLLAVNFTDMSEEEFYESLTWANKRLAIDYYEKNEDNTLEQINNLYKNKDKTFRGFRQI